MGKNFEFQTLVSSKDVVKTAWNTWKQFPTSLLSSRISKLHPFKGKIGAAEASSEDKEEATDDDADYEEASSDNGVLKVLCFLQSKLFSADQRASDIHVIHASLAMHFHK